MMRHYLLVAIVCVGVAIFATACSSTPEKPDPETCAQVYSNDLSVTSKQHYFPIRFREVNGIRVDNQGWGVRQNSSGTIKLEPGKHRLEVFVVTKNAGVRESPRVIDRQYIDVTVAKDYSYELLAFEKQGEDKTLQKSKRFNIEVNRKEKRACQGGRIFSLPDDVIFDDK